MIRQIPNLITSLNLLCGSVAVILAVSGDLVSAAFFILFGIFFDFFDGLAARLLKVESEVGLQFDSLADVITSGLAPSIIMVQFLSWTSSGLPLGSSEAFMIFANGWKADFVDYLPFTGLLIVVASGYRLAKFNVDKRQKKGFIGLPTPANALLILSLPLILHFQPSADIERLLVNKWFLLGLTVLSCFLLNMNVRLFALKFSSWDVKRNGIRYIFLLLSAVLLIWLRFKAIPIIIALYVLVSLFYREKDALNA